MRKTELIKPSSRYADSLRSFIGEFASARDELVPWVLAEFRGDIDAYVDYLEQQARGQNLREGRVPHSTFWLVDGSEILASRIFVTG